MFCCVFLCKQKTAYELRISDWSSDVCSSDLSLSDLTLIYCGKAEIGHIFRSFSLKGPAIRLESEKSASNRLSLATIGQVRQAARLAAMHDRKSVVLGKSVSVRVDLGGRRLFKKKTT